MAENSGIEWTHHTFNPWIGCTKVSAACDNCLHPDTLVMMSDSSWRRIGELSAGDVLYGFSEGQGAGRNRVGAPSLVEAVWETSAPTITIRTSSGKEITGSKNHLFLVRTPSRTVWKRADELTIGSVLLGWGDPKTAANISDPDYASGYVAGVSDGDGTLRFDADWRSDKCGFPQMYWRVAVLETDRPLIDRLLSSLHILGVDLHERPFSGGGDCKPMIKVETRAKKTIQAVVDAMGFRDADQWKAGWLAGFLDTDGFCSGSARASGVVHRWSQVYERNGHLDRTVQFIHDLGFRATLERYENRASTVVLNVNSVEERFRFIGTIRPALSRKGVDRVYGSKHAPNEDAVTQLIEGPEDKLIDITTSTRTFVANGVSTHNCYAEAWDNRFNGERWGAKAARTRTKTWGNPVKWQKQAKANGKRYRVFVASLADVFDNHKSIQPEWRHELWCLIKQCPDLDFLMLTKRPQNIKKYLPDDWGAGYPNVWLGTTVEDQTEADRRIPHLLDVPARLHFLSCEPLLGYVDLAECWHGEDALGSECWGDCGWCENGRIPLHNCAKGKQTNEQFSKGHSGIGWVITGGENATEFRSANPDWFRSLRDQCALADVPFLFKQWEGKSQKEIKAKGRELDGVIHDGYPA